MTYGNTYAETLCEKLHKTYSPRIAAKVKESRDASRSSAKKKNAGAKNSEEFGAQERTENEMTYRDVNGGENFLAKDFGPFIKIADKYTALRKFNTGFKEEKYIENNIPKNKKKAVKEKKTVRHHIREAFSKDEEEKVARRDLKSRFSVRAVICIVFVLGVFMFFLQANSSYSHALTEVRNLREEQTELTAERDRLVNLIGVKDDIREIEEYALNEIGMVKSDYVQSATVSVAGGEHIDVIDAGEAEDANFFSTLLSAMSGRLDALKDYID